MKLEFAYAPLFYCKPFGEDCMTKECICLGHDHFWYTTSMDNYPENVFDFYDHLQIDEETNAITVVYGSMRYTITIELIGATMNVYYGCTTEQFPRGSRTLSEWVDEIVPGG